MPPKCSGGRSDSPQSGIELPVAAIQAVVNGAVFLPWAADGSVIRPAGRRGKSKPLMRQTCQCLSGPELSVPEHGDLMTQNVRQNLAPDRLLPPRRR